MMGSVNDLMKWAKPLDMYDDQIPSKKVNKSANASLDDEERLKYQKLKLLICDGSIIISRLAFLLNLFHMECMFYWFVKSFTMLIKLLGDIFPQIKEFPSPYHEGTKIINDLGILKD